MNAALVNELCLRKRVSEAIFTKMFESGFRITTEEEAEDLTGVKNILESIPIVFGNLDNQFTAEDYITLYDKANMDSVNDMFLQSWTKASQEVAKPKRSKDLDEYIISCSSGNRRNHTKRVVNFPIFRAKNKDGLPRKKFILKSYIQPLFYLLTRL